MWRTSRDWLAGSVLVFVGLLLLAERRFPALVPLIPLLVGLLVLGLCLVRRSATALLIGCVLTAAGAGVLIDQGGGPGAAGVGFLACVAVGFGAATLLALVFGVPGLRLWPILLMLLFGGMAVAVAVGGWGESLQRVVVAWWPVAVVALGLVLLVGARPGRGRGPDDDTRMVPVVGYAGPDLGAPPRTAADVPAPPHTAWQGMWHDDETQEGDRG